jgi:HNH endonuclease
MPRKDPEARRAYVKAKYWANREALLAKNATYALAHPEQGRAARKKYAQEHPEPGRAATRKWRRAHPAFDREKRKRRRAAKCAAPLNDLSHAQWLEIQEAQNHRCSYCGKRCTGRLTQDHLTPLIQGGSHTLQNVIAVCALCNGKKHAGAPPIPVQPFLLTIAPAKKKKAS